MCVPVRREWTIDVPAPPEERPAREATPWWEDPREVPEPKPDPDRVPERV
jgi:hypothetical protein